MRLSERVYLVGSGSIGFDLTDPWDCHIYLIDGGDELALVDVGAGMGAEAVLANVRRAGFDPLRIRHLLLTHAHGDHGGGASRICDLLDGPAVYLSRDLADALRRGDEQALSIDVARCAGIYPSDYRLTPCEVNVELADGDVIRFGDLAVQVVATPGHCDGHVSFLLDQEGTRILFGGDVVFCGGLILLQNIHDCRLDVEIRSLRNLRDYKIDVLLPGHLSVSLHDGQRHIERANQILDTLLIPGQIVSGW